MEIDEMTNFLEDAVKISIWQDKWEFDNFWVLFTPYLKYSTIVDTKTHSLWICLIWMAYNL